MCTLIFLLIGRNFGKQKPHRESSLGGNVFGRPFQLEVTSISKWIVSNWNAQYVKWRRELVEHSLFLCNVARASWFGSRLGLRSHNIPWDGITSWWIINFETTSPSFLKEYDVKAWVLLVWWAIWKANDYLYRSTPLNPTAILKCANSVLCEASCIPRDSPPNKIESMTPRVNTDFLCKNIVVVSDAAFANGRSAFGRIILHKGY